MYKNANHAKSERQRAADQQKEHTADGIGCIMLIMIILSIII